MRVSTFKRSIAVMSVAAALVSTGCGDGGNDLPNETTRADGSPRV